LVENGQLTSPPEGDRTRKKIDLNQEKKPMKCKSLQDTQN
jgi:hypothetical protein